MIIKGNIISNKSLKELEIIENGFLVCQKGKIKGVYTLLPEEYKNEEIIDYSSYLIVQSFSDMHLHAPQFPALGSNYDKELLEWLNDYTFPLEAKFNDENYARKVYRDFAQELLRNGTTRVCMFSSLHLNSTLILMEELEKAGIKGFVGKVNMDQNSIERLTESTVNSINDTYQWLEKAKFKNIKPIITPRFIPSCSHNLLNELGKIASKYNLPIQSHLSENKDEINWVKELENVDEYFFAYQKYNLWNHKTLMAHCVHSTSKEIESMLTNKVTVVHCPLSNINLKSGIAPIRKMINKGVKITLGSDIAAGSSLNVFDIVASCIQSSKIKSLETNEEPLSSIEVWYLMCSSNLFFDEEIGFKENNEVHLMVIDDNKLINTNNLTLEERFSRMIYSRQKDYLVAVYSGDKKVYSR